MKGTVKRMGNAEIQRTVVIDEDFDDVLFTPDFARKIDAFARSTNSSPISTPTTGTAARGRSSSQSLATSGQLNNLNLNGGVTRGNFNVNEPTHQNFYRRDYGQPVTEDSDDVFAEVDNDSDVPIKSPQKPSRPTPLASPQRPNPPAVSSAKPAGPKMGVITLEAFNKMQPGQYPQVSRPQVSRVASAAASNQKAPSDDEEGWGDFDMPPTLKLQINKPEAMPALNHADWEEKHPLPKGKPPAGPVKQLYAQEGEEDYEDGFEFSSSKPNLSLSQKRSISQTNFSGDWDRKSIKSGKYGSVTVGRAGITPPASSNSSAKSESDAENYDDIPLNDNPQFVLRQNSDDDTFNDDLDIPNDTFLDASRLPAKRLGSRSQNLHSGSMSLSRNPSLSLSRNSSLRQQLPQRKQQEEPRVVDETKAGFEIPKDFGPIKKILSDGKELDNVDPPPKPEPRTRLMSTTRSFIPQGNFRPQGSLLSKKTMVSTEVFGDGSELDGVPDLPVAPSPISASSSSGSLNRKRTLKKPVLISNLTKMLTENVINGMKFNPVKQVWEGNESEIKRFDAPTKLGLISHLGHKVSQRVGTMMLDKTTRSWVNVQGSDESSVFDGIEDLKDQRSSSAPFVASEEFLREVRAAAVNHRAFITPWMGPEGLSLIGDDDREHLYFIRAIAMNRN